MQQFNTRVLQQADTHIIYYTDPLCCWSWAFEKEWQKLRSVFEHAITWQYCMGGLLPAWNNYYDAENSISKPIQMGPMWMHAAQLTGVVIRHDLWANDPPASSYPSCIAVKCAALQSPAAEERYLTLLREACMIDGRNITKPDVLLEVAHTMEDDKGFDFDIKKFKQHLLGNEGMEAFKKDLQQVKYRGINRFPTLLINNNAGNAKLITGYQTFETIAQVLQDMAGVHY
ncbi:DsbA family oxidoreductase [Parafilimonas sp.]|uniref:DsbA family oxidoreductase n=1 Tax=Parafilimonas sp. TaxID=1969739 RepID=UPI003F7E7975